MSEHPVFHLGELYLQKLSAVDSIADKLSRKMIVDYLPEQHKSFYPLLYTLYIASVDEFEKPWASIVTGKPGFIDAYDATHLHIKTQIIHGDKLDRNITQNKNIGLLGLEHQTRRRNRASGEIINMDSSGIRLKIHQALGNCPKYIQARNVSYIDTENTTLPVEEFDHLNTDCKDLIKKSDTFFIASYQPGPTKRGADISHRGGKPGFVKTGADNTLLFDDFSGNNLYMTLGNLHSHPYAGLLFINYDNGDLWQLQCEASIIETPNEIHARTIKLNVKQVRKIPLALNIKWQFIEHSKFI